MGPDSKWQELAVESPGRKAASGSAAASSRERWPATRTAATEAEDGRLQV